jgi:uncharacterized protein with FMN-binding domain
MTKKLLGILLVLLTVSLVVTACFVENDPADVPEGLPMGTFSGTADGTARGFAGEVKVTVTLTDGRIAKETDLDIDITKEIDPQAEGYKNFARNMKSQIIPLIVRANSFDIDATCGASYTSPAVKAAGNKALFIITNGQYGKE